MPAEETERAVWGSKLDFILSTLGYAVGLGNIWRFPFYCGRNGGAAFLIAYVIMMIFAGLPMFYLELLIGQYTGKPPHILYTHLAPLFKGLGFCMILITTYMSIYYNMVVAWALFYFGYSFWPKLPYSRCDEYWNTDNCFSTSLNKSCADKNETFFRGQCWNGTNVTITAMAQAAFANGVESPSSQFFNYRLLRITEDISETGGKPYWDLVLCLMVAWLLVMAFLSAGIKSVGKSVYFTTTFPYIVILILVIRGCTLSNAIDGLKFYLVPEWEKLQQSSVWVDAAVQIFFSLSVGIGGLGTLASYNHFHNNALRDTIIVVFGNCLTSFFAGFAIFPILGHLASITNQTVADTADQGPGLTFVAYPSGIAEIPVPQLWSVLFFFMLILLGINTEQVNTEVIITAIVDTFPRLRRPIPRFLVTFSVCTALFLAGLSMTTGSGIYVLNLIDKYAAGWPIIVVALTELITVNWVYGIRRFIADIKLMMGMPKNLCMKISGYPVNVFWVLNWILISPALLLFILIFEFVKFEPIDYEGKVYPDYALKLGWVISISTLVPLIVFAIVQVQQWTWSRVNHDIPKTLIKPNENWLPNLPIRKDTEEGLGNGEVKPVDEVEQNGRAIEGSDISLVPESGAFKFPRVSYENKGFDVRL